MTILTVDIGNTNTCFAVFDGDECIGQWRLSTNRLRTADEFTLWIENFLVRMSIPLHRLAQSIVACVVPSCRYSILQALGKLLGHEPLLVTAELMLELGMQVKLETPSEAGADRLINAYAAYHRFGRKPVIVLDFGTATTFDVANAEGDYCGGVIAPGVNLSLEALHRAAARLPSVEIAKPKTVIGRTTETAMQAGLYYGYLGMVERIAEQIRQELSQEASVVATGGLAPLFASNTKAIDHLDQDLTMQGLRLVAQAAVIR